MAAALLLAFLLDGVLEAWTSFLLDFLLEEDDDEGVAGVLPLAAAAGVFLLLLSLLCFLALVVSFGVSPRLILSLGTDMGVSRGAGGSVEAGLVAGAGVVGGGAAEGGGAGGGAGEEVLSTFFEGVGAKSWGSSMKEGALPSFLAFFSALAFFFSAFSAFLASLVAGELDRCFSLCDFFSFLSFLAFLGLSCFFPESDLEWWSFLDSLSFLLELFSGLSPPRCTGVRDIDGGRSKP